MATPPPPQTVGELADALKIAPFELRQLAERTPYNRWRVPKRAGGYRQIEAPAQPLKDVQRWILWHLVPLLRVHDAAHGCVRGRSTVTFAQEHTGAAVLVRMDVRDFYPSLHRPAVMLAWQGTLVSREVASIATDLCTAGTPRSLPQGAPTSPALANAAMRGIDGLIKRIADQHGARYTRYVDDLAFSSTSPRLNGEALAESVAAMLRRLGLEVHPAKTKILRPHHRQELAGLVVNGEGPPRPSRSTLRRLRAAVHQAAKASPRELQWLRGMIAYVSMSNPAKGRTLTQRLEESLGGSTR